MNKLTKRELLGGSFARKKTESDEAERGHVTENMPVNVSQIDFNGCKIDFVRSMHNRSNTVIEMSKNSYAACFETITVPGIYTDRTIETFVGALFNQPIQLGEITKFLMLQEKCKRPLFGIDCPIPRDVEENEEMAIKSHDVEVAGHVVKLTSRTVILAILIHALESMNDKTHDISRRVFLASSIPPTVALYFGSGQVLMKQGFNLDPSLNAKSFGGNMFSVGSRLFEKQATYIVLFRNLIMAEKLKYVTDMLKKRGVSLPRVTLFCGAGHEIGLRHALALPQEDRHKFIEKMVHTLDLTSALGHPHLLWTTS